MTLSLVPLCGAGAKTKKNPADPVARLRLAVGADRLAGHRNLRWRGEIRSPESGDASIGITGTWETGGRGVVVTRGGDVESMLGFDGSKMWQKLPDGRVRIFPPTEQRLARTELFRLLPGFPFPPGFPAEVTVVGRSPLRFRATPSGGAAVEFTADALGRPALSPIPSGGHVEWKEWREIDGIAYAARTVNTGADGRTLTSTWTSVDLDVDLPDGFSKRPSRGFEFDHADATATVPFSGGSPLPVLDVTMPGMGSSLHVALDLASPKSRLRRSAAELLGADAKAAVATISGARLPGLKFPPISFRLDDEVRLDEISSRNGTIVDATFGADLLLRFSLVVDLEKRRVRFFDPDGEDVPAAGDVRVPLHETGGIPVIPTAAGGVAFVATIDTTRVDGLHIPTPLPRWLEVEGGVRLTSEARGEPGARRVLRLGEFFLGDAKLSELVTRIEPPSPGWTEGVFRLGLGALAEGYFILEPEKERARWKSRETPAAEPLRRAGFEIVRRPQGIVVTEVVDGSPAAKGGLAPGDVVKMIGGKETAKLTLAGIRSALSLPPSAKVDLEIGRGSSSKGLTLILGELVPRGRARMTGAPGGEGKPRVEENRSPVEIPK